jgi:hypothetical protein
MAENPIEDLAESAFLELLRGHHFGRVAFIEHADGRCISVAELPSNWWG